VNGTSAEPLSVTTDVIGVLGYETVKVPGREPAEVGLKATLTLHVEAAGKEFPHVFVIE